jgi:hypothetical protein
MRNELAQQPRANSLAANRSSHNNVFQLPFRIDPMGYQERKHFGRPGFLLCYPGNAFGSSVTTRRDKQVLILPP